MRIKLDENLPLQTASRLKALGHDVHTTYESDSQGGLTDRFGKRHSARSGV
jgi:hypothetical protein